MSENIKRLFDGLTDYSNDDVLALLLAAAELPGQEIDLSEWDWNEAFEYFHFTPDEIDKVLAHQIGENDGDNWIIVARLKSGEFVYGSAGCDYTGWDCQAGGHSESMTFSSTTLQIVAEMLRDRFSE